MNPALLAVIVLNILPITYFILVFRCSCGYVSNTYTIYWWWWKIRNLGKVSSFDVESGFSETTLLYKLGYIDYNRFYESLLDYRQQLWDDYRIMVYFKDLKSPGYIKSLVFPSAADLTLFLLKYS